MDQHELMDSLAASAGQVPGEVAILGVQELSLEDMQARARQLIGFLSRDDGCQRDRADWLTEDRQTLVRLPNGGRALVYHASGAVAYHAGLGPLERLFPKMLDKETLTRQVNEAAKRWNLHDWAGEHTTLAFERLFQSKAQGSDRQGAVSEPVLARVVGAFRQSVNGIPVLGAASAAITLAGDGTLDAMSVQIRPLSGETVDTARVIDPQLAARQLSLQLASLLGRSKEALPPDVIASQTMQFGYLDLGKRKSQRVLAPAYVAKVVLRHKTERQAYVLAVAATERAYLPLCTCSDEAVSRVARTSRLAQRQV